jgi:hypothetical protein
MGQVMSGLNPPSERGSYKRIRDPASTVVTRWLER